MGFLILMVKYVLILTRLSAILIMGDNMTTGQRIREARKQAGMTQEDLAEKLGISFVGVSRWENGSRNPKFETLKKIASALSVSVFDLMDKDEKDLYNAGFNYGSFIEEQSNYAIDQLLKEAGYTYSDEEMDLIKFFSTLNPSGQQKAVERVEELTEIPKYQRTASTAASQPSGGGNYTPAPETPSERKETPPQADAQDGEEE